MARAFSQLDVAGFRQQTPSFVVAGVVTLVRTLTPPGTFGHSRECLAVTTSQAHLVSKQEGSQLRYKGLRLPVRLEARPPVAGTRAGKSIGRLDRSGVL